MYRSPARSCPVLPTQFNVYLEEIITKWQKEGIMGIPFLKNQQQVHSFNYQGNSKPYEKEVDIDNKFSNYLKVASIINNVFRPQKTLKKTRIKLCLKKTRTKLCITLALPALLYRSENWTIKARDKRRITAAEMKGM
jgi:hypothetical protein